MSFMPSIEQQFKFFLLDFSKIGANPLKISGGFCFWFAREISRKYCLLMKVAHLTYTPLYEPK